MRTPILTHTIALRTLCSTFAETQIITISKKPEKRPPLDIQRGSFAMAERALDKFGYEMPILDCVDGKWAIRDQRPECGKSIPTGSCSGDHR